MRLPNAAVLELTYKCNHKCKFCSCPWYDSNSMYPIEKELDLEQWKQVINKLYSNGVNTISITGGECMLKEALADILLYIKEESRKKGKSKDIVLISNGLLMNRDYLLLFKYCNVHLSMSLPGIETFEEHTGVNNAEGVLHWFQEAQKLGMNTTVNVTVTKKNYHELFETVSLGLLNGATSVLVNRFLPGGRGLKYMDELMLSREELNEMLNITEKVLSLAQRYGHTGTEIPLCAIDTPTKYKWLSFGTKCAAAKDFFVVDPAGHIRTCNHSPRIVGNILDDDIIQDTKYWNTFARSQYHPAMCMSCNSVNLCDCGCREVAHILKGSVNSVDISSIGI